MIKRLLLIWLLLLLPLTVLAQLSGWNLDNGRNYLRKKSGLVYGGGRIVIQGDSTNQGYQVTNYIADSWGGVLQALLTNHYGPAGSDGGAFYASSDGFGSNGSLWTLSTGTTGWTQYDESTSNSGSGLRTIIPNISTGRATATLTLDGSSPDSLRQHTRITGFELIAGQTSDSGILYIDVFNGSSGGTVGTGGLYSGSINLAGATTILGKHWGFIPVSNTSGPITIQISSAAFGSTTKALFDGIVTYCGNETSSVSYPGYQVVNVSNGGTEANDWNPSGGTANLINAAQLENWNDSVTRPSGSVTRKVLSVFYSIGYNKWYGYTNGSVPLNQATTFVNDVVANGTRICNSSSRPLLILELQMQPKVGWYGQEAYDQYRRCMLDAYSQLQVLFGNQVCMVDENAFNDGNTPSVSNSWASLNNWFADNVHPNAYFHCFKANQLLWFFR